MRVPMFYNCKVLLGVVRDADHGLTYLERSPDFDIQGLWDPGPVIYHLKASVSSPVKWG